MNLAEIGCKDADWIQLAQDRWRALEYTAVNHECCGQPIYVTINHLHGKSYFLGT